MPAVLNSWLNTPLRRSLFFLAMIFLLFSALRMAAGTIWGQRIGALIVAGISIFLAVRFWRDWIALRRGLQRWEMRVVKSWREFSRHSPFVQAMHVLSFALALLWTAAFVGLQTDLVPVLWLALLALALAGICEMAVQTGRLLRKAWAPFLGKVLTVSLGVALAAVSLSNAKQLVHAISAIDPKYMTEFTAILGAVYLPIAYLVAACVAMSLYALFQMLVFWFVSVAGMLAQHVKPFLGDATDTRSRLFWYRIKAGKKPPGGVLPPRAFLSPSEISLLASPLSKVLVAVLLVEGVQATSKFLPFVMPSLTRALVEVEYREKSSCKGVPDGARVVYMDDGNISIAERSGENYLFRVTDCKY